MLHLGSGSASERRKLAEVVGERVELEPHGVVPEDAAGQPRPAQRTLALS